MFALSLTVTNAVPSSVPAIVAAPASGAAVTRVTSIAVSPPPSDAKIKDDGRANTQVSSAPVPENAAGPATAAVVTKTAPSSGPSTAFLTQLISQNSTTEDDSQIALSSSFAHFLPAPQYNELVGYSVVKFRPSNAGLPSSDAALSTRAANTATASDAPASVTSEYSAYRSTQTRNQSDLFETTPQIIVAG